jgi:hypothetical protein
MAYGLRHLHADQDVRKRLAKLMALRCIRNKLLEDYHAGKVTPWTSVSGDHREQLRLEARSRQRQQRRGRYSHWRRRSATAGDSVAVPAARPPTPIGSSAVYRLRLALINEAAKWAG